MQQLPLGESNFQALKLFRDPSGQGYLYIDKTMFIKEVLYDGSKVIVITRPRRFGKTMNLSMLQCFLAENIEGQATKDLFINTKISQHPDCMQHQGQSPVIFLSLKGIKGSSFDYCMDLLQIEIQKLFGRHRSLFNANLLDEDEKNTFSDYLNKKTNIADLSQAVAYLAYFIFKTTGKKPYLLLDEYDTAIQEAYSRGFYQEMIGFMRGFFSASLKDNSYIHKAILTGILRVSKESLFSDLNNVTIYSMMNPKYKEHFGFTETEVEYLFEKANFIYDLQKVKAWFNGYEIAGQVLYNPWSIINCLSEKGLLKSYWINTSGNALIREQMIGASPLIKEKLQSLIEGKVIKELMDEHVVFVDLQKNASALWSLLVMSGYLNVVTSVPQGRYYLCDLKIPNHEIMDYYRSEIEQWLAGDGGITWYMSFLEDFTKGNILAFEEKLQILVEGVLSYHDQDKRAPEMFFHGLTLGLTAGLTDSYEIKSNRESGHGRFDLAFFPKDSNHNPGIIIEFKAPATSAEQILALEANKALAQIEKQNYTMEMQNKGVLSVIKLGIALSNKQVKVAAKLPNTK